MITRNFSPSLQSRCAGLLFGGVRTADGVIAADIVVCAAGFWGAQFARQVGLVVPLVPMAHQYARTGRLESLVGRNTELAEAGLPILRHQDADLYLREHVDRLGIGSYSHRPMPVDMSTLLADTAGELMPSMMPFTEDDFAPAWRAAAELIPALEDSKLEEAFNGVFSFTPDGFSIVGEHRELLGFWVAEAVWLTHSAGVARATAEWIIDGTPSIDTHECDLYRFEDVARSPRFVMQTSSQAFVEVYDVLHLHQYRSALRGLRTSPFHSRQVETGAFFYEGGGWERRAWFEANDAVLHKLAADGLVLPERDEWAARFWSPISVAEAHWTRQRVAMHDMTPLTRYEVSGRGALAFLQRMTSNNVDKSVGSSPTACFLTKPVGYEAISPWPGWHPSSFRPAAPSWTSPGSARTSVTDSASKWVRPSTWQCSTVVASSTSSRRSARPRSRCGPGSVRAARRMRPPAGRCCWQDWTPPRCGPAGRRGGVLHRHHDVRPAGSAAAAGGSARPRMGQCVRGARGRAQRRGRPRL